MNENPEFRILEPVSNGPAIERLPIDFAVWTCVHANPGFSGGLPFA